MKADGMLQVTTGNDRIRYSREFLNQKDSTANFWMQNSINSNGTVPARKSQRSWSEKYHKAQHPQAPHRYNQEFLNPKDSTANFLMQN